MSLTEKEKKEAWKAIPGLILIVVVIVSICSHNKPASKDAQLSQKNGQGQYLYVKASALNVRSGPGTNYGVIKTLKMGQKIPIYEIRGSWAKVQHNPSPGYVKKSYLESASEQKERMRKERRKSDQKAQASKSQPTRSLSEDINSFLLIARAYEFDGCFTSVSPGLADNEIKITVSNAWHYEPYQIRLQLAQALWEWWSNTRCLYDRDKARIILVDAAGNKLGGSSSWAGSSISLKKD